MESIVYIFVLLLGLLGEDEPNSKIMNFDATNQPKIVLEWRQFDGN